jgi:hypothetical protein
MTAYEFTRFTADYTAKEVAKKYDLGTLEFLINYHSTENLRETPEYEEAKDIFYELTMSCNEAEAINWAKYWIMNAIAYGNQTKNKDWRQKFLAANDLYEYLLSQRCTGIHSKTNYQEA